MTETFKIDDTILSAELQPKASQSEPLKVVSVPFPYQIEWLAPDADLSALINADDSAIVLADKYILERWLPELRQDIPTFVVEATEANKTVHTAIEFAEFMEQIGTTKANMVYVVGGGIMQDIGAFACAMYKRGIPWTYFPTTLLGMADSCIGGKTGLNHKTTKNLMALFSAPRRIIHFLPFLDTLPEREILAGYGEALRLHATGGRAFLEQFAQNIDAALAKDTDAIKAIIIGSLSVKRAVVEEDEFERSLRRSMNYGHSVGHALEALTEFAFPHGMGISIGVAIENRVAVAKYGLDEADAQMINALASKLIDDDARQSVVNCDLSNLLTVLKKDKKTLGHVLKMAVPVALGDLRFHDFPLDEQAEDTIKQAILAAPL